MPVLGKLWAGQIYGTNTGKIFLDLEPQGDRFSGTLKLSDDNFGLTSFSVDAAFENGLLSLEGSPLEKSPELQIGKFSAHARCSPMDIFQESGSPR